MGEYVQTVNSAGSGFGQEHSIINGMNRLIAISLQSADSASQLLEDLKYQAPDGAEQPTQVELPGILEYQPSELTDPTIDLFEEARPEPPELFTPPAINFGQPPEANFSPPSISFVDRPTPTAPILPTKPQFVERVSPDDPMYTLPDVPTLRALNIPSVPTIIEHAFTAVSPTNDTPEIVAQGFIWDEVAYSPKLAELSNKIAHYLSFDFDAAETAIWERGQERVERSTNEAILGLTNDIAARGFSLPTGVMLAAASEMRMKGAEAKYDNARDAMIKAAEINTQKLTLVIQSGIQYEAQWMNYTTQYAQRAFDAVKLSQDAFYKVLDAKIALYNSRVQSYQVEAQVHRDLIQAELLKLEAYKSELEGQKIIGELNLQDVELYKAKLGGVMSIVEIYKAKVEAFVGSINADKTRIEMFGEEVAAYKAQIDANAAEYAAWSESLKAESVKAQVYETEVKAFASLVDAYRTTESVVIEQGKFELATAEQNLRNFEAELKTFEVSVQAYMARLQGQTAVATTKLQTYATLESAAAEAARVNRQIGALSIEANKANALMSLEHAHKSVIEAQENGRIAATVATQSAQVYAQLAASAMSALNYSSSSSMSSSLTNSLSESYSASI